ncbi:MAG: hypothetical protein ACT4PP_12780 [Sporichthyaceae bacterium]
MNRKSMVWIPVLATSALLLGGCGSEGKIKDPNSPEATACKEAIAGLVAPKLSEIEAAVATGDDGKIEKVIEDALGDKPPKACEDINESIAEQLGAEAMQSLLTK